MPDLHSCTGVAGYLVRGDQLYVHTLGLRRTELVLKPLATPGHLRLADASATVHYMESGTTRALLQVAHCRPVEMTFAGMTPGTICQMIANGQPEYLMADTAGRIEFTVPGEATVQLKLLPAYHAAMR